MFTDGNSLLGFCQIDLKSPPESVDDIAKGMYLKGYLAGFCGAQPQLNIPPGVTFDQIVRVILKWLQNHPERLHEDARVLIYCSLVDAFPAKEQR